LDNNLKQKSISGIIWNLTERLGNQFIRFFLGIILARMLFPADYGIVGLTTAVIVIAQIFIDGGFMMVLIQRKKNSDIEYSTVFWIKVALSLFSYSFIYFSSFYIAQFYKIPQLESVLQVIALVLIISALSSVHKIKLTNELNFKAQAKIMLFSTIVGGLLGIILAYRGYGVWSLVYQNLAINVIQTLIFWIYARWIPSFNYSRDFVKSIRKTGFLFLLSNVLLVLYNNIYVMFIGKLFSATTLGNYTRAAQFEQLPENTTNSIIVKVLFPVLAENKDDLVKLKANTLMILSWLSFIITPIMVILIINAERIITLFLTKKWIESSGFLIVLCISGIFIPINNTILNIFNVLAKPLVTTYVFLFKIIFSALCIVLLFNFGPLLIANVIVVENIIVLFILGYICNKIIDLSTFEIFKSIGPAIFFNTISALIIVFIFKLQFLNAMNNFVFVLLTSTLFLIFVYLFNIVFKTTEILKINRTITKYVSKCF
jgi:O-antigen/teichoic acid export membrane protein